MPNERNAGWLAKVLVGEGLSDRQGRFLGSAVLVSPEHALTCWHVVAGVRPNDMLLVFEGAEPVGVEVVGEDHPLDLALLHLERRLERDVLCFAVGLKEERARSLSLRALGYRAPNGERTCTPDLKAKFSWDPTHTQLVSGQVDAGVHHGLSGGAALIDPYSEIAVGLFVLGGEDRPKSRFEGSDSVLAFLRRCGVSARTVSFDALNAPARLALWAPPGRREEARQLVIRLRDVDVDVRLLAAKEIPGVGDVPLLFSCKETDPAPDWLEACQSATGVTALHLEEDDPPSWASGLHSLNLPRPVAELSRGDAVRLADSVTAGCAWKESESGTTPFPGLDSFDVHTAKYLFGRDEDLRQVLRKVGPTGKRWLVLDGPSGVGKSSLVKARLVPALRAPIQKNGTHAFVALVRPGEQPIVNLAEAVWRVLPESEQERSTMSAIVDRLSADKTDSAGEARPTDSANSLSMILRECLPEGAVFFLVVDPFEELFVLAGDEHGGPDVTRQRFGRALASLLEDPDRPFYLVTSLRNDSQPFDLVSALYEKLNDAARHTLMALKVEALIEAIECPLLMMGRRWERGLPERLAEEAQESAGALPLLSHALWLLYEKRGFTNDAFQSLARANPDDSNAPRRFSLAAVVDQSADGILEKLPKQDRDPALNLLSALVCPGRGTRDLPKPMSREQAERELGLHGRDAERLLRRLTGHDEKDQSCPRLLNIDGDTIELIHASLLEAWPTLQTAVAKRRQELEEREDLEYLTRRWKTEPDPQRRRDWLKEGPRRLALAQVVSPSKPAQVYLAECLRYDQQQRRTKQLVVTEVLLIVASFVFALWQMQAATKAREETIAVTQLNHASDLADYSARSSDALALALSGASFYRKYNLPLSGVAVASLVKSFVTFGNPPVFPMFFMKHDGAVKWASFSPDGSKIVTVGSDKTARVWSGTDASQLCVLEGHMGSVEHAEFSPDGSKIVTASWDKTARVWSATGDNWPLVLEGHKGPVVHAEFSPNNLRIATASVDGTARVWSATDGRQLCMLEGHIGSVEDAEFSPDSLKIVTAGWDHTARVWSATDEKWSLVLVLTGHIGPVKHAEFSPDGSKIVTASWDRTAMVWSATDGTKVATLVGHEEGVGHAEFSPDGLTIVTSSIDQTARIWRATDGTELHQLRGHQGTVMDAEFSPDGSKIVTASWDKTARVWSADGKELFKLEGHTDSVEHAEFSSDGSRIVTVSGGRTAGVWFVDVEALVNRAVGLMRARSKLETLAPDVREVLIRGTRK